MTSTVNGRSREVRLVGALDAPAVAETLTVRGEWNPHDPCTLVCTMATYRALAPE